MRRIILLVLALVIAVQTEAQDPRQINWMSSFDAALATAKKRNVPILVAINIDTYDKEKSNVNLQMARICYHNLDVVKISRKFVCLVAGEHARPSDIPDDKAECRRFGKITYTQLQTVTASIRERYFEREKNIVAPQHLILNPAGKIIDRYYLSRKPGELVTLLKEVLARYRGEAPARVVPEDAASVIKALKSKDDAERAAAFRKALDLLTADKNQKNIREAAAKYIRTLKGYQEFRRTLEAIGAAGTEGPLSLLLPYLTHRIMRLRRGVLEIYARSKSYETFVKPLGKRVKGEKVERPLTSLVKVLEKYADTFKESLTHLNKMVSHKNTTIKILATFAAARPGNKPVYKTFLARARKEANVLVRAAAILALAKMKAKEALPTLYAARKKEKKNPRLLRALDIAITTLGGKIEGGVAAGTLEDEEGRTKRAAGGRRRGGGDDSGGGGGPDDGGRGGRGGGGRGR